MHEDWTVAAITAMSGVAVAVVGFLGGVKLTRAQAHKAVSEGDATVGAASLSLATALRAELDRHVATNTRAINELEGRVERLERLNEWYRRYNAMLIAQVHTLGQVPNSPDPSWSSLVAREELP
jgi:hypothetical protein